MCATFCTNAGVQRNTLIQVLQLLRFLTACRCVRDAGGRESRSAPLWLPTSSRSGRSLQRRALYAVRFFPVVASALSMSPSPNSAPLHVRVARDHARLSRAPARSHPSVAVRADRVSLVLPVTMLCAHNQPAAVCRSRLWDGLSVSLPRVYQCLAPAALFFRLAHATSPAQRVKKAPLHRPRPLQDPRGRRPVRVKAFLTRRSVRCWFLHTIENSTP